MPPELVDMLVRNDHSVVGLNAKISHGPPKGMDQIGTGDRVSDGGLAFLAIGLARHLKILYQIGRRVSEVRLRCKFRHLNCIST